MSIHSVLSQQVVAKYPEKAAEHAAIKADKFNQFLKVKAETGFSFSDKLKYRYVEFKKAESFLARLLVWCNLGGVDALFIGKSDDIEELKMQSDFYRGLCKAESLFTAFAKKPNEDKCKDAMEVFEALHAFAFKISGEQNSAIINKMVEKATGKAVSNVLLEEAVKQSLKASNVLGAQTFMATIKDLFHKGYRPEMSGLEKDKFELFFSEGQKIDEELEKFISNENYKPFFMLYAKAYRSSGKKIVPSLDDQIDIEIGKNNKKLLDLIINPPKKIDESCLPFGVTIETLKNMIDSYQEYRKQQPEHAPAYFKAHEEAKAALSIVQERLKKFAAETVTLMPIEAGQFASTEQQKSRLSLLKKIKKLEQAIELKLSEKKPVDALVAKRDKYLTQLNNLESEIIQNNQKKTRGEIIEKIPNVQAGRLKSIRRNFDSLNRDIKECEDKVAAAKANIDLIQSMESVLKALGFTIKGGFAKSLDHEDFKKESYRQQIKPLITTEAKTALQVEKKLKMLGLEVRQLNDIASL